MLDADILEYTSNSFTPTAPSNIQFIAAVPFNPVGLTSLSHKCIVSYIVTCTAYIIILVLVFLGFVILKYSSP